jgi:hypothetical protein
MPEQVLHRPDIVALLQQVRRKGVPKRVETAPIRDPRLRHRDLHIPLRRRLVQIVPPVRAGQPVLVVARRRKDPLPLPLPLPRTRSIREFAPQDIRQRHRPQAARQVTLVQPLHALQVRPRWPVQRARQDRRAILVPLPTPHDHGHAELAGFPATAEELDPATAADRMRALIEECSPDDLLFYLLHFKGQAQAKYMWNAYLDLPEPGDTIDDVLLLIRPLQHAARRGEFTPDERHYLLANLAERRAPLQARREPDRAPAGRSKHTRAWRPVRSPTRRGSPRFCRRSCNEHRSGRTRSG